MHHYADKIASHKYLTCYIRQVSILKSCICKLFFSRHSRKFGLCAGLIKQFSVYLRQPHFKFDCLLLLFLFLFSLQPDLLFFFTWKLQCFLCTAECVMSYRWADTVKAFPWNRSDKTAGGICSIRGLKGLKAMVSSWQFLSRNTGGFGSLQPCLYPTLSTNGARFSVLNPI